MCVYLLVLFACAFGCLCVIVLSSKCLFVCVHVCLCLCLLACWFVRDSVLTCVIGLCVFENVCVCLKAC